MTAIRAETILFNGRIATLDPLALEATAVAIRDGRFLAPPLPPVSPDWAPTGVYGGVYHHPQPIQSGSMRSSAYVCHNPLHQHTHTVSAAGSNWGIGCSCFAF